MESYNLKSSDSLKNINYIKYKKEDNVDYFFDDSIGIIKNFEKCINDKNLLLSDIRSLNEITKLKLIGDSYYLCNNIYLGKDDYKKYVNEYFDKKINKLCDINLYATLKHIGKYDTIYQTYSRLLKVIKAENKKIVGPPMEQFICGRWNEKDESKYMTNIMIPIA